MLKVSITQLHISLSAKPSSANTDFIKSWLLRRSLNMSSCGGRRTAPAPKPRPLLLAGSLCVKRFIGSISYTKISTAMMFGFYRALFMGERNDRLFMATLLPSRVAKYRLGKTNDAVLFHLSVQVTESFLLVR